MERERSRHEGTRQAIAAPFRLYQPEHPGATVRHPLDGFPLGGSDLQGQPRRLIRRRHDLSIGNRLIIRQQPRPQTGRPIQLGFPIETRRELSEETPAPIVAVLSCL